MLAAFRSDQDITPRSDFQLVPAGNSQHEALIFHLPAESIGLFFSGNRRVHESLLERRGRTREIGKWRPKTNDEEARREAMARFKGTSQGKGGKRKSWREERKGRKKDVGSAMSSWRPFM